MVVFTSRTQRSVDMLPVPVGVFEDDSLLLRLAMRSRLIEFGRSSTSRSIDPNDFAFEQARRMNFETWDL